MVIRERGKNVRTTMKRITQSEYTRLYYGRACEYPLSYWAQWSEPWEKNKVVTTFNYIYKSEGLRNVTSQHMMNGPGGNELLCYRFHSASSSISLFLLEAHVS